MDVQTIIRDLPYMLSFANASDIQLVNRPKMAVFVIYYRNHGVWENVTYVTSQISLKFDKYLPTKVVFTHTQTDPDMTIRVLQSPKIQYW